MPVTLSSALCSHDTTVQDNDARLFGRGALPVAKPFQGSGQTLGVGLVHLAADGPDIVTLGTHLRLWHLCFTLAFNERWRRE